MWQSIWVATILIVALTDWAETVRSSIVFWVVIWLAVMLGGIEINIAKAKLKTMITNTDRAFFLEIFLTALVNIPKLL
jgi:hypothetical protein